MRLLFLGDVVGRCGRDAVCQRLPELRRRLAVDFVVVNGENASHGFGITPDICRAFYAAGADVITTGNHAWDRREIIAHIAGDPRLLRPLNYPDGTPGLGCNVYDGGRGRKVVVMQLMGRLFMDPLDDPFAAAERALRTHRLGVSVDCIVCDVHASAQRLVREVTALYCCGPAGGGGVRTAMRPRLGTVSCLVPRAAVTTGFTLLD